MDRSTVDEVMEMIEGTQQEAMRRRRELLKILTYELSQGPLNRFHHRHVKAAVEELLSQANGNQVWAAYMDRKEE